MKVAKTHIRLIRYAVMCAALYAVILLLMTNVFGVRSYHIVVDSRITPSLATKLITSSQKFPQGLCVMQYETARTIQQTFPWVSSVSFHRVPTNAMIVNVAIDEPTIRVNDAIITQSSHIFSSSIFVEKALNTLPAIQVIFPQGDTIPTSFIRCAQTLVAERFEPYTITWIDEYHARLTDKMQPQFIILFNAHTIPDTSMLAHCTSIKHKLEERGVFGGRHKDIRWIADIRFDRQVIVFSEEKGMAHG